MSPNPLTIKAGDTVKFVYSDPGNEIILTFTPSIGKTLKMDAEFTTKSFTFITTGTYTYYDQGNPAMVASIIVQ
jgi:plastocyanin